MVDYNDIQGQGLFHSPRNVEQITKAAREYQYSAAISSKYWLRSAAALLKEADIYEREGDDEQTYLLLFRHAHLILANLAGHPDVKDKTVKQSFLLAQTEVNKNLRKLDALKPRINGRYERFLEISRERDARTAEALRSKNRYEEPAHRKDTYTERQAQRIQAHENEDLAVQLAHQEFSRRAARQETRLGVRPSIDGTLSSTGSTHSTFKYPSVPSNHNSSASLSGRPLSNTTYLPVSAFNLSPPALPAKPLQAPTAPPPPAKVSAQPLVAVKEPAYTFAPTAYLENGNVLRTLFLPPTLRTTFLLLAYSNTKSNLETCGFLAGSLIANALFVSKLIVPSQISTSDTCEMTNESQLFDYVDAEADLMILGWIHTHPTQSCFMSSRDLHTHSGYQMMLAESVAIVCAPSNGDTSHGGDWGAYRLTDPPGKNTILKCQMPGIFHPHDVENIYTDALRPGHVVEAKGLDFEVVDLRS